MRAGRGLEALLFLDPIHQIDQHKNAVLGGHGILRPERLMRIALPYLVGFLEQTTYEVRFCDRVVHE